MAGQLDDLVRAFPHREPGDGLAMSLAATSPTDADREGRRQPRHVVDERGEQRNVLGGDRTEEDQGEVPALR
jgi:hypothetical protein